MKHTKKKRLLAIVLCMILVLSTGIAAFANENVGLQSVACQAATLERVIKNADGEEVGTLIADIPEAHSWQVHRTQIYRWMYRQTSVQTVFLTVYSSSLRQTVKQVIH